MKTTVGISNRHVHLNNDDYKILFGERELEKKADLKQPGNFASTLMVSIEGTKGRIDNVRVLGPNRSYTQVEVSRTDSYVLGVKPPVRNSGELSDAAMIKIIGPFGEIERPACIIATRHIHVDKKIREEYGLVGINEVKVHISSLKGGIMENVYLKDAPEAYFELHIDTDDANAFFLNNNDEVEILL